MMTVVYEPGDGSFEITLQPGEVLPEQWNTLGVTVLREVKPHQFIVEKRIDEKIQNNIS